MKQLKNNPSLFTQLVIGKLRLNPLWQKKRYRIKFLLRSVLLYPETLLWLKKLAYYPEFERFIAKQTNLPCKLHRPYLANRLSRYSRFKALSFHYDFISQLPINFVKKCYAPYPTRLATITGKNDLPLFIYLESDDKYAREGELTITVCNQDQIILAALTFTIIRYKQHITLFIGGLQGSNHENLKSLIQQATKIGYGAFPKTLAVETALTLADFLGIKTVLAVSNKTHIYNNWRYVRKNRKRYADYDNYWVTLQGVLSREGYYMLPVQLERKEIESIVSKKRSEYRNKYQVLNKLHADIKQRLSDFIESVPSKDGR